MLVDGKNGTMGSDGKTIRKARDFTAKIERVRSDKEGRGSKRRRIDRGRRRKIRIDKNGMKSIALALEISIVGDDST